MYISLVTETYPPEINGVANTLQRMVAGLTARGHRIQLIRPRQRTACTSVDHDNEINEYLTSGIAIPGYPGMQFGLPADFRLKKLWHDRLPDLVYIATEGPLGMSALATCRRLGIPAITGLHTNFHQYSRHYGLGLIAPVIRRHLRRFHNRSQATLVPTRAMANDLRQQGFDNIQVWPRGVDSELFRPMSRDLGLRRQWGLRDGDLAVLYVGRIAPEKNIDLVVQSFQAIRAYRPKSRLILVGDGPARERLAKRCPGAIFTGPKLGQELARHYASADLFLFPSLTDTFGNVVLEAMASGLPVAAFNQAAAAELIQHQANGCLVDGEDDDSYIGGVLDIASQHATLERLGRAARETAIKHHWPELIAALEQLFRQTCAESTHHEDAA